MLWDPKNDFYTLYSLRDWLATRPADEPYTWPDCRKCVVGKYLEAHSQHDTNYIAWINRTPGADDAVNKSFNEFPTWEGEQESTMGQALKRLDEYMAQHPAQAA